MDSREFIFDEHIESALERWGWTKTADEGRLMLVELMVKASNRIYISHTEQGFLSYFKFLRKDKSISRLGHEFLCAMLCESSNGQSLFAELSKVYRTGSK